MITCDVFEVEVETVQEPLRLLKYRYWTDLPAGTFVILDCTRSFVDHTGKERHWALHNERLMVSPSARGDFNGGAGEIAVNSGDQAALKQFEELLPHLSAGMRTPPTSRIRLHFSVGARQRLKAFGRSNEGLGGAMVSSVGEIKVVRVEQFVDCPLDNRFNPLAGDEQAAMSSGEHHAP